MDDVTASFEGDFKQQATVNSNWLPLGGPAVPNPRPGRCHNSSSTMPESSLHFIKNHCLMDRAVASSPASPVFLKAGDSELLTRLVIQPGVRDLAGVARDLFYVGTNRGRVLRIATDSRAGLGEVLEEIQVFPSPTPVLDLVLPSLSSPFLLVVSADRVHSLPLVRCNLTMSPCNPTLSGVTTLPAPNVLLLPPLHIVPGTLPSAPALLTETWRTKLV